MIYLIGLGLWDEKSMSMEALETAKKCDILYAEFYTSKLFGTTIEKLEKTIGKKIKILSREEVEQGNEIINSAREKKVGFLVAGDALTATTHIDLIIQAKKEGVDFKVVHGASIYTAAPGLAGLQIYKFGRATSVPFPEQGFHPETPYEVIKENKKAGLHTLIFLDIKGEKCLTANEAMLLLLAIENKRKENVFTEETEVCVVARAGSENPTVKFGKVKDVIMKDFGKPLHALIVPGKLHFKEREALELWR